MNINPSDAMRICEIEMEIPSAGWIYKGEFIHHPFSFSSQDLFLKQFFTKFPSKFKEAFGEDMDSYFSMRRAEKNENEIWENLAHRWFWALVGALNKKGIPA